MSKHVLIDTIGRVFVDSDFRNEFNNNRDSTLAGISGLTDQEKQFLKDIAVKIRECTEALDVRYEGENKRR